MFQRLLKQKLRDLLLMLNYPQVINQILAFIPWLLSTSGYTHLVLLVDIYTFLALGQQKLEEQVWST